MSSAASRLALLHALSGLAAAVVPLAAVVHLLAEGLALQGRALRIEFAVRHLYMAPLLLLCAWWFGHTVGLGSGRSEMTRRCALVRARLRGPNGRFRFMSLLVANCAFFCITQGVEGLPIASAPVQTLVACLSAAALGSLLAAVLVFRIGPSLLTAALVAIVFVSRTAVRPRLRRLLHHVSARHASRLFTLFQPKRPPPKPSFAS